MAEYDLKRFKLISSLYKGPHYNQMAKFKDDIVENHKAYGSELFDRYPYLRYTFSDYSIKTDVLQLCPGIGKIFATLMAFEEDPSLHYVVYADFDSLFVKENRLDAKNIM